MTTSTSSNAITSAWITSLIEPLTKTVSSMLMSSLMSSGSDSSTSAISAFTPCGDFQHVGGGLRHDAQAERRRAVRTRDVAQILGSKLDVGDFAEAHHVAALAAADDELTEIVRRVQPGVRAQRELALARLDAAGRQLDVLGAQRILDVLHGQLARGQRLAVEPHAHGIAALAADADLRHAAHHRETVDQVALRVVGQLELRARAALIRLSHMIGSALVSTLATSGGSASTGRLPTTRATRSRTSLAADSMSRLEAELDGDARALVLAARAQRVDAFDAGDLVLDDLRDLGFDDCRGGAAVDGVDADDRRLDVRRFAHRQAVRGHHADDRQQQAHDHREDRAADGDVGEDHAGIRSGSALAARRGRRQRAHPPAAASPLRRRAGSACRR